MQHLLFGLILVFVTACQPLTVSPDVGSGSPATGGRIVDSAPLPKAVTPFHVTLARPAVSPTATDRAAPPLAPTPESPEKLGTVPTAPKPHGQD